MALNCRNSMFGMMQKAEVEPLLNDCSATRGTSMNLPFSTRKQQLQDTYLLCSQLECEVISMSPGSRTPRSNLPGASHSVWALAVCEADSPKLLRATHVTAMVSCLMLLG